MATNTYVALKNTVVANNTTNYVEFTAIPQTYTDLVLVCNITSYGGGGNYIYAQWGNGSIDTASNYSTTVMSGYGSSTISSRWSNRVNYNMDYFATPVTTEPSIRTLNIMNYSNTTMYKSAISRAGRAGAGTDETVGLWRSTQAINTLRITTDTNFFASGSSFALYGIAAEAAPVAKATGGTITYSVDGYTYHTFTSSGTFTPLSALVADMLVVAGGGGTTTNFPGGGGAGGLLGFTAQSLTATGYAVTVGAGGTASTDPTRGGNGNNSQFGALTLAIGGGGSGARGAGGTGSDGGSGGGGAYQGGTGGLGTAGQGSNGGNWGGSSAPAYGTGGGGGATVAGTNGSNTTAGAGGNGSSAYSTWGAVTGTGQNVSGTYWFAGGGGAVGDAVTGTGGFGGGGTSVNHARANGTANTGGGGAGESPSGATGGSGIVIVRYASV